MAATCALERENGAAPLSLLAHAPVATLLSCTCYPGLFGGLNDGSAPSAQAVWTRKLFATGGPPELFAGSPPAVGQPKLFVHKPPHLLLFCSIDWFPGEIGRCRASAIEAGTTAMPHRRHTGSRSTDKVGQAANVGKARSTPDNPIVSGGVHGKIPGHCSGVVCQTIAVVRYAKPLEDMLPEYPRLMPLP